MTSQSLAARVMDECFPVPGSAEGETEAAWVMTVTWAVADELLRTAPSAGERQALLQRIISLDLPVPGGSGSARYGSLPHTSLILPMT